MTGVGRKHLFPATCHLSPVTLLSGWHLSAGALSEWARPAVFVAAALVSVWVFYDARRRETAGPLAVSAWALLTLLFPPAVLPLYLAARLYTRRAGAGHSPTETEAEGAEGARAVAPRRGPWPPLLYAAALGLLGGVYFYADYMSFDARLARAERAKLYGRVEPAIAEYRGALRLREDARTRQLLGLELLRAGRAEEALAELRAAAAGPDTDGALLFDTALALEALTRREEAAAAYRRFLAGPLCTARPREPRCDAARARLGEAGR